MQDHSSALRYSAHGRFPWWGGLVLLSFSLLFLGSLGYYELRLLLLGNRTEGQISRFERPLSTTFVYVKFRTADQKDLEFRWPLAMRESFAVGQTVQIRYLPDRPTLGRILTFSQWWLSILVKLLLGLMCGVSGLFVLLRRFRARRSAGSGTRG